MKIDVNSIPPQGKTLQLSQDSPWVVKAIELAFEGGTHGATGKVHLTVDGKRLTVNGDFNVSASQSCSRCLAELKFDVHVNDQLIYLPEAGQAQAKPLTHKELDEIDEEYELSSQDLDLGWYTNGKIDLSEVLCEFLVISGPARVYCDMTDVQRTIPGKCIEFEEKQPPMTHKPFADLDLPE